MNPNLLHVHDLDRTIYMFMTMKGTGVTREIVLGPLAMADRQYLTKRIIVLYQLVHVYIYMCMYMVVVVVHEKNQCISYCHTFASVSF